MTATAVAPAETPLQRHRSAGRLRGGAILFGPAFVASVAYVDPGNYATNVTAGALHGYRLVWVVVAANLMAMVIQVLSAKLGIATGRSLPELCRESYSRPVVVLLWLQAEIVAIATDLAEVLGSAIALYLIFGIPLLVGGLVSGAVAFALLGAQTRGFRPFEVTVAVLLTVVAIGLGYDLLVAGLDPTQLAAGFVPRLQGQSTALLTCGIVGATVMPHVIYLHSHLTSQRITGRTDAERRTLLRFQRIDVVVALGIAGLINVTLLVVAAQLFHRGGKSSDAGTLIQVHARIGTLIGGGAALAFALALLASGIAASGVGTYAGQAIMDGFLHRRLPIAFRRAVTLAPALIVLALTSDTSHVLVISQVVLSFGIPFALLPLLQLTNRRDLMGPLVNRRRTATVAWCLSALIIALNAYLLASAWL